jgi:anti-sigma regulatory factor (Ser/Thr protein kinase)
MWGLGGMRADAELVVSELMSNAVRHAPADASHQLHIVRRADGVRLVVTDASSAVPAIRPIEDGQIGGRGLRIVGAITSSWGYDPHPLGKIVWAELASRQPDGNA